jgi:hypothetical protein
VCFAHRPFAALSDKDFKRQVIYKDSINLSCKNNMIAVCKHGAANGAKQISGMNAEEY